jgi:bacteriorhodopsin
VESVDSLLSFVSVFIFAVMVISCGSIIGAIAKRKHRNPWLWKATGAFGFLVALIAILCFKDLNALSAEEQSRSRLKEKLIFVVVIFMFVAGLFMYLQME